MCTVELFNWGTIGNMTIILASTFALGLARKNVGPVARMYVLEVVVVNFG